MKTTNTALKFAVHKVCKVSSANVAVRKKLVNRFASNLKRRNYIQGATMIAFMNALINQDISDFNTVRADLPVRGDLIFHCV